MRAREGDLIKTKSNVVFDVKGLVHPERQDCCVSPFHTLSNWHQTRQRRHYGKVYSLSDRFKYLQENHPDFIVFDDVFGETMCEVPINQIAEHYKPEEKLWSLRSAKDLTVLESKALQLAETLKQKQTFHGAA